VDIAHLEPQFPTRVEAAGEARHEALERVAVAVAGAVVGRGEEEEDIVVESGAEEAEGVDWGGRGGERISVVCGGVVEGVVVLGGGGGGGGAEEEEEGEAGGEVGVC